MKKELEKFMYDVDLLYAMDQYFKDRKDNHSYHNFGRMVVSSYEEYLKSNEKKVK